jgi:hypothetical protein
MGAMLYIDRVDNHLESSPNDEDERMTRIAPIIPYLGILYLGILVSVISGPMALAAGNSGIDRATSAEGAMPNSKDNDQAMAKSVLRFPMSPENARNWQFVTDQVMGGVSTGQLRFEGDEAQSFARMTGDVSTKNNGGFIQLRAGVNLSAAPNTRIGQTGLGGIRIMARGNGETYYIHLRTRDTRRPWHYYAASFTVGADWQIFDLPFDSFIHSNAENIAAGNAQIPTHPHSDSITSIGIVAYGRDYAADISIAELAFF